MIIVFRGHSFNACLFPHLDQNIVKITFSSSYFFLVLIVSNCELRVLRMFVLKFSKRFPNSALVTPPEANLFILVSWIPFPFLALLHEYFLQRLEISSKVNWEISLVPIRLITSMYSSWIPFRKIVLTVLWFNLCLYFYSCIEIFLDTVLGFHPPIVASYKYRLLNP